jgi:hypothetical protein
MLYHFDPRLRPTEVHQPRRDYIERARRLRRRQSAIESAFEITPSESIPPHRVTTSPRRGRSGSARCRLPPGRGVVGAIEDDERECGGVDRDRADLPQPTAGAGARRLRNRRSARASLPRMTMPRVGLVEGHPALRAMPVAVVATTRAGKRPASAAGPPTDADRRRDDRALGGDI